MKHLLQKKVLKTKTKKKTVLKTKTKKKPTSKKPPQKRKPLYTYIRRYCLDISFGNLDRFAHRLQREFPDRKAKGSQSATLVMPEAFHYGADNYEDFLIGDTAWNGQKRVKEEDLSFNGQEYDNADGTIERSMITIVRSTKAKRAEAKALVEALLLSYGFIPTMFRMTERTDHQQRYNADIGDPYSQWYRR